MLGAGGGEIVVGLTVTATGRASAGRFVDEMASWLGIPLQAGVPSREPPGAIIGTYVKLSTRDDAGSVRWDMYKLFLGEGDDCAEVFLRVAPGRAAFSEKWSAYREVILVQLDRHLGLRRTCAQRQNVDVFGGASSTVLLDWLVSAQTGHVRVTDASDEAVIEISHQPYSLHPRLPGVAER